MPNVADLLKKSATAPIAAATEEADRPQAGMSRDFSWDVAAAEYSLLYAGLLNPKGR